jgi:hypothetical protein
LVAIERNARALVDRRLARGGLAELSLGLSVVDRVARAYRATVALEAREPGGLRAQVVFSQAR